MTEPHYELMTRQDLEVSLALLLKPRFTEAHNEKQLEKWAWDLICGYNATHSEPY